MSKQRAIGTWTERQVEVFLLDNGFPFAERRSLKGSADQGDITGTPGIVWEVKGGKAAEQASDLQVLSWMMETRDEQDNADADYGVLVLKRAGYGGGRASEWWAVLPLQKFVKLFALSYSIPAELWFLPIRTHLRTVVAALRYQGYGDPISHNPSFEQEQAELVGGQKLRVHPKGTCAGEHCTIHNPSDHHMVTWPQNWRGDRKLMERICPHGIGHPDPDDINPDTMHGCDFCCISPDAQGKEKLDLGGLRGGIPLG